jgi:hypothetical protein
VLNHKYTLGTNSLSIIKIPQSIGCDEMGRTLEEIMVQGRSIQEVRGEVHLWMEAQGIKPMEDREDFIKGRLGIPGNLGLTAPKYFEIRLNPKENGVLVHTEGWIGLWGGEQGFSKGAFLGGIPRREGWKVIENLWNRLKAISE